MAFRSTSPSYSLLMAPLADRTWLVNGLQMPSPVTLHFGETTVTYRWNGVSFEGTFDPSLATFFAVRPVNRLVRKLHDRPQHGGGRAPEKMAQLSKALPPATAMARWISSCTRRSTPSPRTLPYPYQARIGAHGTFQSSYGADGGAVSVEIDSLEAPKLAELLAYVVARAQERSPALDNQKIKEICDRMLPIYERIEEQGTSARVARRNAARRVRYRRSQLLSDFCGPRAGGRGALSR